MTVRRLLVVVSLVFVASPLLSTRAQAQGQGPAPASPDAFGHRWVAPRGDRVRWFKPRVVAGAVDAAPVGAALDWLASRQRPDGSWSEVVPDGAAAAGSQVEGIDVGARTDVGVTGLALLAFLADGHTDKQGAHRRAVRDGMRWLLRPDGDAISIARLEAAPALDRVLAAHALSELWHITNRRMFQKPHRAALALVQDTVRERCAGPPRPAVGSGGDDVAVVAWGAIMLHVARLRGTRVELDGPADVLSWLDEHVLGPERASEDRSRAALALFARLVLDPASTTPGSQERIIAEVARWLGDAPLERDGVVDVGVVHPALFALYQHDRLNDEPWRRLQPAAFRALEASQSVEGEAAGSWAPAGRAWGRYEGPVSATALATISLLVTRTYGQLQGDVR